MKTTTRTTAAAYITDHERRQHRVRVEGVRDPIPGEILALCIERYLQPMRHEPALECFGCKGKFSADHLYRSDVPGECDTCAAEFFCPHGGHPDDPCDQCDAEATA